MKKIICPFCFHKFSASDLWFRCENSNCRGPKSGNASFPKNDPVLDGFWNGNMGPKKFPFQPGFSLFGSSTAKCPACKEETLNIICPNCHSSLDREMMKDDSSVISIIGGPGSGKTNYITVLIWELLKKSYTFDASIQVITCGDYMDGVTPYTTAHRYKKDFYNLLFEKHICHASTQKENKENMIPLIYRLTIGEDTKGRGKGKSVFLVFYDTAGESFFSNDNIAQYARFLKHSAGIIFLLDTWGIAEIQNNDTQISQKKPLRFNLILDNLLEYLQNKMKENEQVEFKRKPIALSFSKIDTVLNNNKYDLPGLGMNKNSSFLTEKNQISLKDLSSMHTGLNSELRNWGENQFLRNVKYKLGEKVRFFGFSALGQMPSGPQTNIVTAIQPYRVLDPLVWILYELGYPIPLKKEKQVPIKIID